MVANHMVNVLIVDDHELVRTGIGSLLNSVDNISAISFAECGEGAITAVEDVLPDVVLMDINMPGIGGIEACRRLLQHHPGIKIIGMSVHNDGPIPPQLLKLGVQGFISKSSSVDEMVNAIQLVVSGKKFISSDVANNLALSILADNEGSPFERLSQREIEVVGLVLQGKSIQEMAEDLSLSDKTINTYRYRIYKKLGIRNDVELTRMSVKYNFIDASLI